MLKRLLLTSVVALLCLGLLTLENKCSYFLGTQDLTAVVTQAEGSGKPMEPTTWHVQLQDVAGNIITPTPDDIDALSDRLTGGVRGLKQIPVVGDIQWSTTHPEISLTIAAGVAEEELHARLQSVGYTCAPTRRAGCSTSPRASTCAAGWSSSAACTRTTARWCPQTTRCCTPCAAASTSAA